jgi:hypothetical protein
MEPINMKTMMSFRLWNKTLVIDAPYSGNLASARTIAIGHRAIPIHVEFEDTWHHYHCLRAAPVLEHGEAKGLIAIYE